MKKKKVLKVITEIAAEETDKQLVFFSKRIFFQKGRILVSFLGYIPQQKILFFK